MPDLVKVKSHAKINWTLDVMFKREDGYHELRTIYQTVSLHDDVLISATAGGIEVHCEDARVPCDASNLAFQAAQRLRAAVGERRGARIEIVKRIPVGGGLGGGSSNAAAVLAGLPRAWGSVVDERIAADLAVGLGSDVPFFLVGGTALGVGRGEEVYPLEEVGCEHLVLVNPGFSVPTGAAYAKLSRLTRQHAARMIPFTFFAAKGIRTLPLAASNDFEKVVLVDHPEIADLKHRLFRLGAVHALLSGSGGTVFGVFDNLATSEQALVDLRQTGLWAESVRAVNRREYFAGLFC